MDIDTLERALLKIVRRWFVDVLAQRRADFYEPPVVTPVGNLYDLLAEVCADGECDPD